MELKQQLYEEKQKRKFKAKKVPEFAKLQTEFEEKLKAMKDEAKRQRKRTYKKRVTKKDDTNTKKINKSNLFLKLLFILFLLI